MRHIAQTLAIAFSMAVSAGSNAANAQYSSQMPQYITNTEITNLPHSSLFTRAVSFNYVLEIGRIRFDNYPQNQLYISWQSDDAFIRTYKDIREKCITLLKDNDAVKQLLSKDTWTKQDRQNWQKHLCETIAKQVDLVPGLDKYRAFKNGTGQAAIRSTWVNALSYDIENGSHTYEFECEFQSALKGCLAQDSENTILAEFSPESAKSPQEYYYIAGHYSPGITHVLGHVYVMTPTGDTFECAQDPSKNSELILLTSVDPTYTLEKFMRGEPNVVKYMGQPQVYGRYLNQQIVASALKKTQQRGLIRLANSLE